MIKIIGFLLMVMIVSISLTGATSSQDDKYTVVPIKSDDIVTPRWVSDTIAQGETNWHGEYIDYYTTSRHIDLNWGDTSDSLRLKVYSPSNELVATYYDSSDGVIDGRINMDLRNPSGIEQGLWWSEVYGYSVTGTEDYYI